MTYKCIMWYDWLCLYVDIHKTVKIITNLFSYYNELDNVISNSAILVFVFVTFLLSYVIITLRLKCDYFKDPYGNKVH